MAKPIIRYKPVATPDKDGLKSSLVAGGTPTPPMGWPLMGGRDASALLASLGLPTSPWAVGTREGRLRAPRTPAPPERPLSRLRRTLRLRLR